MEVNIEEFRDKLEKLSEHLISLMIESNYVSAEVYIHLEIAQDMVDSAIEAMEMEKR